jgi:hypothetical protein
LPYSFHLYYFFLYFVSFSLLFLLDAQLFLVAETRTNETPPNVNKDEKCNILSQ